jgi:hypothetical protein
MARGDAGKPHCPGKQRPPKRQFLIVRLTLRRGCDNERIAVFPYKRVAMHSRGIFAALVATKVCADSATPWVNLSVRVKEPCPVAWIDVVKTIVALINPAVFMNAELKPLRIKSNQFEIFAATRSNEDAYAYAVHEVVNCEFFEFSGRKDCVKDAGGFAGAFEPFSRLLIAAPNSREPRDRATIREKAAHGEICADPFTYLCKMAKVARICLIFRVFDVFT